MNNLELLPVGFVLTYVIILGLCIGSFLNVVILRGLSGEDIVFGRSHCPKCKNQLKWYMNIPLLSYIFLGGKCAFCKTKISMQYPIVEALVSVLFVCSYLSFGMTLKTLFAWIFLSLFTVMSVTDIKETVIIDYHAYILCFFGLIYSLLNLGDINIIQSIIGAVLGFVVFEILARIGILISGCRMFGEGDSLIALGIGAIFGYKILFLIILLSILFQSISSIPILIKRAINENKPKLVLSYIFVFLGILSIIILNYLNISEMFGYYFLVSLVVTIAMIWCLKNILSELRSKKLDENKKEEDKFCILPFGPALLISSTLCLFYLPQIKNIIKTFIS